MQDTLFAPPALQSMDLGDGAYIHVYQRWLTASEADSLFTCFLNELLWKQPSIRISGRKLPIPRLQSWYGDEGITLRYSGTRFLPTPWHPRLNQLRDRISSLSNTVYNSVLANLYRDGNDSVGWHADDERELGENPTIASLSLGETRKFQVKPKSGYLKNKASIATRRYDILLEHGDLIIMSGTCQQNWQHAIPKTKQPVGKRINLTFRHMLR